MIRSYSFFCFFFYDPIIVITDYRVSVNERAYICTSRQVIKEKSKTQACLLCHCQPDKRTILASDASVAKAPDKIEDLFEELIVRYGDSCHIAFALQVMLAPNYIAYAKVNVSDYISDNIFDNISFMVDLSIIFSFSQSLLSGKQWWCCE